MIFISLAHSYIPKILCSLAILINTFFIILVYTKSSPSIGKYKYLLITFSSVNILATCLDLITPMANETFKLSFIVFVADSLIYKYRDFCQFMFALRCCMIAYTFGLISVHFLYRYFAICQTHLTVSFFKLKYVLLIIFLVFVYGSTWMLIIMRWLWPDDEIRMKIDSYFLEKYNESTNNIPFIIANYGNPDLGENALLAMGLATLISISSLIFDAVLATKIYLAIKVLNLSDHVKKMHRILLITLIAQTSIPSFLTFIPCFISWFYPILNLDLSSFCNSILAPMISSYPVIDPLVIILALADYREAVIKFFRRKTTPFLTNSSTFMETTRF
ncbi:unnamed protein product [Caenorhabditis angaria]|uniref:G-protein coupled receptors family 1 profile domain-containing protein n=1 Tax=Caenorhabditis angaria TaxID=860376 RepID=A0A9P1IT14_9PELO|nr:unnamed protein product [Caenorhabditis angaria]